MFISLILSSLVARATPVAPVERCEDVVWSGPKRPNLEAVEILVSTKALAQGLARGVSAEVIELIVRRTVREPLLRKFNPGGDPEYTIFQRASGDPITYVSLNLRWQRADDLVIVTDFDVVDPESPPLRTYVRTSPIRGSAGRLTIGEPALEKALAGRISMRELVEANLRSCGPAIPKPDNPKLSWKVGLTREDRPISLIGIESGQSRVHLVEVERATLDQRRFFISRSGQAHDDPRANEMRVKVGPFRKRNVIFAPGLLRKLRDVDQISRDEIRRALEAGGALVWQTGGSREEPRFYFVVRLSDPGGVERILRVAGAREYDGRIVILSVLVVDLPALTSYHLDVMHKSKIVHP